MNSVIRCIYAIYETLKQWNTSKRSKIPGFYEEFDLKLKVWAKEIAVSNKIETSINTQLSLFTKTLDD